MKALGQLAASRRHWHHSLQVAAITGSSGKTTVKEMTAGIFNLSHRVLKTGGNFNNLIGLPLTLFRLNDNHDVAILEMGMNRPGEIARLTEIADPDIACIINVQEAHLEGLGDIQGVARANDQLAIDRILDLDPKGLYETVIQHNISMCGVIPTTIVLAASKALGATKAELVEYATSGDVTGDYAQVVGYAGFVVN